MSKYEDWIPTIMEFNSRGIDPSTLSLAVLLDISSRIRKEQDNSLAATDPRAFVESAIGHKPKGPVLAQGKFGGKFNEKKNKVSFVTNEKKD
jgi:hypothetical protein